MSISKDPLFRDQYAGGVQPDPEVEAALAGNGQPRREQPSAQRVEPWGQQWLNQSPVKLR